MNMCTGYVRGWGQAAGAYPSEQPKRSGGVSNFSSASSTCGRSNTPPRHPARGGAGRSTPSLALANTPRLEARTKQPGLDNLTEVAWPYIPVSLGQHVGKLYEFGESCSVTASVSWVEMGLCAIVQVDPPPLHSMALTPCKQGGVPTPNTKTNQRLHQQRATPGCAGNRVGTEFWRCTAAKALAVLPLSCADGHMSSLRRTVSYLPTPSRRQRQGRWNSMEPGV
jgi:hypothetical protein